MNQHSEKHLTTLRNVTHKCHTALKRASSTKIQQTVAQLVGSGAVAADSMRQM